MMKLLKITYLATVRYVESVPFTGEVETVDRKREPCEALVVIKADYPSCVHRALAQFDIDHQHDSAYQRTGHEIAGDIYAIYREPMRML